MSRHSDLLEKQASKTQPGEWLDWICASENAGELKCKYDQWADDYDAQVGPVWQSVPNAAALMLANYIQNKESLILDVGAGTGFGGVALAAQGFRRIIGIDPSPEMLEKARGKGVYQSLQCCAIGDKSLFELERADGIIALGVFAANHAGAEELAQLEKTVKAKGIVVFTSRRSFLPVLQPTISRYAWKLLSSTVIPVYDDPIHLFAFQFGSNE